jgi:hypothetical protein
LLGGDRSWSGLGHYPVDIDPHEITSQVRQSVEVASGVSPFDHKVAAFLISESGQSSGELPLQRTGTRSCCEEADLVCLARLLRPRGERPADRRAAEQRDELAALHSITSSASNCIELGTESPRDILPCVW